MREKLTKHNQQTGFTIIEVVLVLAIAGLIFLIVFLALPQLQRSRRDTQRKSDAGRALSALESHAGNNNGAYPAHSGWAAFVTSYIVTSANSPFNDPSTGVVYGATAAAGTAPVAPTTAATNMQYAPGHVCSGQSATTTGAADRDVAIVVYQESGGSFCQDNK